MDPLTLLAESIPCGFFAAALFWAVGLGVRMGRNFLRGGGATNI